MDPTVCKSLTVPLYGAGERTKVTITEVYADGSKKIVVNDLVKGSAYDVSGTYTFVYANHSIETVPASGSPIQVEMTDSFILNGDGSAGHLNVGFNWRWTYTPPAAFWPPVDNFQEIQTRGDPFTCDPI